MDSSELDLLKSLESQVRGTAVSDEEIRERVGNMNDEDQNFLVEALKEDAPAAKAAAPKEEHVEDDKPVGLSEEVAAQIKAARAKAAIKAEETKVEEFDVKKFVELLNSPETHKAWDYIEPHTNAGKRISKVEAQLAQAAQERRADAAERFIEKNPDYPFENADVNDFMAAALDKLGYTWTAGNLSKVWKQAKEEGLVRGKKVQSETVSETKAKPAAKAATAPPVTPGSKGAKTGPATTGAADATFFSNLDKLIETSDPDELEDKLRRAGLMEPGSLSRVAKLAGN